MGSPFMFPKLARIRDKLGNAPRECWIDREGYIGIDREGRCVGVLDRECWIGIRE